MADWKQKPLPDSGNGPGFQDASGKRLPSGPTHNPEKDAMKAAAGMLDERLGVVPDQCNNCKVNSSGFDRHEGLGKGVQHVWATKLDSTRAKRWRIKTCCWQQVGAFAVCCTFFLYAWNMGWMKRSLVAALWGELI